VAVLGRKLLVGLAVLVASAAVGGCASSARSDQPAAAASTSVPAITGSSTANASHDLTAANEPKGLLAEQRGLALAAAHLGANQIAVGRNSTQVSGWPSGINAVFAVLRPGIEPDSNTGHTCDSGTIIDVRLLGAFDTVTTGMSTGPGTAVSDNTVREIDLSVDATTGLTCLTSVRTEPAPQSRDETVLYSR
jgi:outer membrane murein-binding lipoprotein Lpp